MSSSSPSQGESDHAQSNVSNNLSVNPPPNSQITSADRVDISVQRSSSDSSQSKSRTSDPPASNEVRPPQSAYEVSEFQ